MSGTVAGIAAITIAYPRANFPTETVALYARMLADLDDREVAAAVERLIKRSAFPPAISEIREEVVEARLGLPDAHQAWDIANRGGVRDAPEPVREAVASVGGTYSIRASENPTVLRSQFMKDYDARRRRAILIGTGAVVPIELEAGGQRELVPGYDTDIPDVLRDVDG